MDNQGSKYKKGMERLRELRPIDDDFMRCMFKDNIPLAQLVLRIITGKQDLIITECQTQKDMKRLVGARSLCLDAYGTDSTGKKYDLEIQRADKGAEPHRARYHSCVMGVENLDAGQDFSELPDTYTIFITEKDFYGRGEPVYFVRRVNITTGEEFDDGDHILYVNGEYRGDSDIGKLMHDFNCSRAGDMNFDLMADRARYLKENEQGVSEMCKIVEEMVNEGRAAALMEGRREGRKEGQAEGREEGIKIMAVRMLEAGKLAVEEVSAISGLPLEEIKRLQAGLKK